MDPIKDALTRPDGIAARLTRLREQAGLAAKDLAAATGFFASKVSRLENGRQTPSDDDIRAWVQACGADESVADDLIEILAAAHVERRTWRLSMRRGQSEVQAHYNRLAAAARLVRHLELTVVPGLIQTPAYATVMLSEMIPLHRLQVNDVPAAVAKRMERQQHLYDTARQFEFLLAESVLRWELCPADVMLAQLGRVLAVMDLPNVRLGILPFGKRLPGIPQNSVVVYVGNETVASVDTFGGATFYDGSEAQPYLDGIDRLWPAAEVDDAARALIARAMDELRRS